MPGHSVTVHLSGVAYGRVVRKHPEQVLVNGTPVDEFSFDISGTSRSDMGYRPETVRFTSPGPNATVEFRSTTPTVFGPVIDKVSVKTCLLGLFCS